jgi:hypothetical protein
MDHHISKPLFNAHKIMDTDQQKISWNSQLERIISDEGERSLCFVWLHTKAEKYYAKLNTYISLPVILLSTIAGAGSFGSQSLFNNSQIANIVIGGMSITVAALNTVAGFFAWAKRSESHRIASSTYGKIYRFILIELALPRSERIAAKDMLKIVREQCDRLADTSPQIPDKIIQDFKKKFGDSTPDVKKPEITNGLDPIMVHPPDMDSPMTKFKILSERDHQFVSQTPTDIKTSIDDHTLNSLQMSSSVHPLNESASGNNHT